MRLFELMFASLKHIASCKQDVNLDHFMQVQDIFLFSVGHRL